MTGAIVSPHTVHTLKLSLHPSKRQRILAEHGLDFADAAKFFDGRAVAITPSPRFRENRICATAVIEGQFVTLVAVWRSDTLHVITMRRAHAKEERQYRQLHAR